MSLGALVPIKRFDLAKSRLADHLPADAREAVARTLFTRVLDALAATPELDAYAVITKDAQVAAEARAKGALVLDDPPDATSLGEVVDAGLDALFARGLTRGLVVMGDLPLATPASLGRFIASARPDELVMAPDRDGQGTNVMQLPLPRAIATRFGEPGSGRLHRDAALAAGLEARIQVDDELAFDLDLPEDLVALEID